MSHPSLLNIARSEILDKWLIHCFFTMTTATNKQQVVPHILTRNCLYLCGLHRYFKPPNIFYLLEPLIFCLNNGKFTSQEPPFFDHERLQSGVIWHIIKMSSNYITIVSRISYDLTSTQNNGSFQLSPSPHYNIDPSPFSSPVVLLHFKKWFSL